MTSSDGAGMIDLAKHLRSVGYDNVYVYNCTSGGSTVLPPACDPAHPHNHWHSFAPDSPLTDALTQVSAGGKAPQMVIWMEGEQAALYSALNPSYDMVANYATCLSQLRDYLTGQWGECPWMVTPVGYVSYGNTQYVRRSQEQYASNTPGVFLGPSREDLELLNEGGVLVHLTGPSCQTLAGRIVNSIAANLGLDMQDQLTRDQIAELQAAMASIGTALGTIESGINSLQTGVESIRKNLGKLRIRVEALEGFGPPLIEWPKEWP
jgi:hypothetical protein